MPEPFATILLLVSLAGYVFLFLKLRAHDAHMRAASDTLDAVRRTVDGVAARLDGVAGERGLGAAGAMVTQVARMDEALRPLPAQFDALRARCDHGLAEVVASLGRLTDGVELLAASGAAAGAAATVTINPQAAAEAAARTHLAGLGVAGTTIDSQIARPDGALLLRARGMMGQRLWSGTLVVRGDAVESATELPTRLFP